MKPAEPVEATEPIGPSGAPTPRRLGSRGTAVAVGAGVLVVLALGLLVRLGAQERGGPPHNGLSIGPGIPATLYVPGRLVNGSFPMPKPVGQRPPLVVIAHGYSADQQIMSPLARSLARAGYAALTFDFRGHGSNTAEFKGDLRNDLRAVLDWAETSPDVDAGHIAVLGHSMGAGAALDFGTLDPRPEVVIPVSGGFEVHDQRLPAHLLFVHASGDPGFIKDRQRDLVTVLQGRTDVSSVEIAGADHASVVRSGKTVTSVVAFLDHAFGRPAGRVSGGLNDPRLGTVVLYLLVALGLVAVLGLVVGSTATPLPSGATGAAWVLLVGAVLVTMPLLAVGGFNILPLGPGQPVAVHMALAGGLLWATRLFVRRGAVAGPVAARIGDGPWMPLRSVIWPALVAGAAIFVLLTPTGVVFHRLVPDPERLVLWVLMAALMLPFFAAFEAIVRRGGVGAAIGWGVLGRVMLLVALFVGVGLGVLPGVLTLVLPILVLQYIVLEVFAATCYASGRNTALIAVVDSLFVVWLAVMLTPIG